MAQLSPMRHAAPLLHELQLMNRGKVRDTYELNGEKMLVVSTDGLSIFDFVLNALVPEKGMILTAMSHFWFRLLGGHGVRTHFVAAGSQIDAYLPAGIRGNQDLQSRAMVVERLDMHPVEFIARACLTGTGLKEYKRSGTVCGHRLPEGLQDGDQLPYLLDTPTTKAEDGHDEALDAAAIRAKYPRETQVLLDVFTIISSFAEKRGILFADTKLEFGRDREGRPVLGDEVATPDSSRWWDRSVWLEGRRAVERKAPPPFDKQLVRAWGIGYGVNTLNPLNPDHVVFVHALVVPAHLIRATTQTYRYIFWRLFAMTLEEYLYHELGVLLPKKKKRVAIVFGSASDIEQVSGVLRVMSHLREGFLEQPSVHIVSCHRNPIELDSFAASGCSGADVVIAAGGKAFALPGVLDALLQSKGMDIPVIGVALGKPDTRAFEAAKLSIEELPGQPVVMDEVNGRAYAGVEGFLQALERVSSGELPPPKPRVNKPAKFNIDFAAE